MKLVSQTPSGHEVIGVTLSEEHSLRVF